MKATLRYDGTLVVTPETDLEAFAFSCWLEKNAQADWFHAGRVATPIPKVVADMSAFADRLGLRTGPPSL